MDFVEAQALCLGANRVERPAHVGEPRLQIIGRRAQTTWTATATYCHDDTIRLVSV
jgi:uncharacterized DUF497 family protein